MITILKPNAEKIYQLQTEEKAFYWSGCADLVLAKHGLKTSEDPNLLTNAEAFYIILRDYEGAFPKHGLYEGPLKKSILSKLGLVSDDVTYAEQIRLLTPDRQGIGGILLYGRFTVKRIPTNRKEKTEAHEYFDADTRWHPHDIPLQFFSSLPEEWETLALGEANGQVKPIVISNGNIIIAGLPLLDILSFNHAMPALSEGFYTSLKASGEQFLLEKWLVNQTLEHAGKVGVRVPKEPTWPYKYNAALSIRHDYDRPISDKRLDEILLFYAKHGLKATWFLLVKKPPSAPQINAMLALGHEVALHTVSSTLEEFIEETIRFRELTGVRPLGFNCHGGIGSSGHLALTHNSWALRTGMLYGEMIGRCRGLPHPLILLDQDIPSSAPLIVQECHRSLDLTTKPDGHQLEKLVADLPPLLAQGSHVTIMNHPDIHWDELQTLLSSLNLRGVWCETLAGVATWFKGRTCV